MAYGIAINPTRICVEQTSVSSTPGHGCDIREKSVEQPVVRICVVLYLLPMFFDSPFPSSTCMIDMCLTREGDICCSGICGSRRRMVKFRGTQYPHHKNQHMPAKAGITYPMPRPHAHG